VLLLRSRDVFCVGMALLLTAGLPVGGHAGSQPFLCSTGCNAGQLPVPLPAADPSAGNARRLLSEQGPRKGEEEGQTLRIAYRAAIEGLDTN